MSKPSRTESHHSSIHTALIAAATLLVTALTTASSWGGSTKDDHVIVTASEAAAQGAPVEGVTRSSRIEEWIRSPACRWGGFRHDLYPGCISPSDEIDVRCPNGSEALDPWWMRYRRSSGAWSAWIMVSWYQCPADMLRVAAEDAWARMRITPNTIHIQPDTGWVLTTVPTIVYVDRSPRTMRTTLLGTSVTIRATPSAYTWTWGDGTSTTTAKPGATYPNQTVTHTYLNREGSVTIRLRTSWRGSYTTDGGRTWRRAPGTAYTTSTPITVDVHNPHGHRVDCDVDGTCISGADGPADET